MSRVGAEAAALVGPVELKSEFSWHRSRLDFGDARRVFRSTGWYGQAGFWLGGRRVPFGVPEVDEPLFDGGAGAFQFAVRYAHLRMDDDLEEHAGFTGARRVDEISAVVNGCPNENVLVSVAYVWVGYSHNRVVLPSGRDIDEEDVVAIRMQIGFESLPADPCHSSGSFSTPGRFRRQISSGRPAVCFHETRPGQKKVKTTGNENE